MEEIGTGRANGKIILMGEHAVVYGQPAIAMPFSAAQITATIHADKKDQLNSSYYSGLLAQAPASLQNIQSLIANLRQDFSTGPINCTITSSIPAERGMGSSAAVAVAITRAFFDWQQVYEKTNLLTYVNQAEKIAHGNPSGIDAAATSGQEPIFFQKDQPLLPFPLNLAGCLIVADTGVKGKTRDTVSDVARLMELNPLRTQELIDNLGSLTYQAKAAITNNQPVELGFTMTQAHHILQQLSVSDGTLDRLVKVALHNGALGAKLTGGGRGGCMIALADNPATAQIIANQLQEVGARQTWLQTLGEPEFSLTY